jgi:hypothetical protein
MTAGEEMFGRRNEVGGLYRPDSTVETVRPVRTTSTTHASRSLAGA